MITVENLLMAYVIAYDAWLDPETERENPTPEYAELIRRVVSAENAKLQELVRDYYLYEHYDCHSCRYHDECRDDESCTCIAPMRLAERVRELGVEVDG